MRKEENTVEMKLFIKVSAFSSGALSDNLIL